MTPKTVHSPAAGRNQHLILVCQEGYQPSLAAAVLLRTGLVEATDLDGGFVARTAVGYPVTGRRRVTGPRAVDGERV
jgi:rhodanese-related sulfurtransferase